MLSVNFDGKTNNDYKRKLIE